MITKYVIRRTTDGTFFSYGGHDPWAWATRVGNALWADSIGNARLFDFMTTATYYALVVLNLNRDEFTIELF